MAVDALEFWEEAHTTNPHHLTGDTIDEILVTLLLDKGTLAPGKTVLTVGVGNALYYPGLAATGCQIASADISPSALKKVATYGPGYLPSEMGNIPPDSVDICLHRLVAQHMADGDLFEQLQHIFAALKPTGLLAIQFAGVADNTYNDVPDLDPNVVLAGGRCRSDRAMRAMVGQAGGEILADIEVPTIPPDPKHWVFWRTIHAIRARKRGSQ